jgi:hypothetical protein
LRGDRAGALRDALAIRPSAMFSLPWVFAMVLRKVGVGCDDADDDARDESSKVNSKAWFGKQAKTLVPTQSASQLS